MSNPQIQNIRHCILPLYTHIQHVHSTEGFHIELERVKETSEVSRSSYHMSLTKQRAHVWDMDCRVDGGCRIRCQFAVWSVSLLQFFVLIS